MKEYFDNAFIVFLKFISYMVVVLPIYFFENRTIQRKSKETATGNGMNFEKAKKANNLPFESSWVILVFHLKSQVPGLNLVI